MSVKGSHITTPLTEHVREVLPDVRVAVFRITFGVEAVYLTGRQNVDGYSKQGMRSALTVVICRLS